MSIPGSVNPLFLGAAGQATGEDGYQIERILRFNSPDSAYLSRTPASAGNRTTWTWAGWVKRSSLGSGEPRLFRAGAAGNESGISWGGGGDLYVNTYIGSSIFLVQTTQVFRDFSAWYHIVVSYDSDNATPSDRIKIWVNGVQVTSFASSTYPSLGYQSLINSTSTHYLGWVSGGQYFDGYLADIHFIDGQALTPSSFTEVSATTGQLVPIEYTGTYGTNGFRLAFSDNSTAAALGTDTSGNGNTWTVNNISVANNTTSYVGSTSGSLFSGSWINAFDGIIPSGFKTGAPYNYNTTSTLTFTSALSGTIEVYGANGGSGTGGVAYIALSDGSQWSVANIVASSAQWYSFGSKTGITSISLVSDGSSQGVFLSGIRVNGVVLVDKVFNSSNDSLVDTPTSYGTDTGAGGEVRGNYATLNPLANPINATTFSNGNLQFVGTAASHSLVRSTIAMSSGKWYAEFSLSAVGGNFPQIGILDATTSVTQSNPYLGQYARGYAMRSDGQKENNNSTTSYGSSFTTGDIIGVAFDADAGTLTYYKNNVSQGTAFSSIPAGSYLFAASAYNNGGWIANWGARPFAYTAPSGFKALCDTNLPAPVVAKPNTLFDVATWSGTGATNSITFASGLSPDFVWIKARNAVAHHVAFDIIRGANKAIYPSLTNAEDTYTATLNSFDSSGFTLGYDDWSGVNQSGRTYVGWTWDAGSSTVSNTQGSITSQVRANPSAGFSIVTYTGSTSGSTVGHGLGVAPAFIFGKRRDGTSEWSCYHQSLGNGQAIILNTTAAAGGSSTWNSTTPTSSVVSLGPAASVNFPSYTHVLYCFAPVEGYSAFGSYTGNGSADGPFIFTSFMPRWIMVKRTSATDNWYIWDTARDTYNLSGKTLLPNLSNAEPSVGASFSSTGDILSNGFKLRDGGTGSNASGSTYIYAAFAEHPFAYARAR